MPRAPRQRSKYWCITINNPTNDVDRDRDNMSYIIMANEVSETGTPHIQGFVIFDTRKYLSQVRKIFPRCHAEKMQGTPEEASHYCKKPVPDCECKHCVKAREAGQIPDFIERGILPTNYSLETRWSEANDLARLGKLDEIEPMMLTRYYHAFKRMQQDNPVKPNTLKAHLNYWIVAPTGFGKSTYARKHWPDYYDKAPNKWFVGYTGETTILLDDFGPEQCKYLAWYLKRWADLFAFPVETKGGGMPIRPKHIVLTSQYQINECFEDPRTVAAIERRFVVLELQHWEVAKNIPIHNIMFI